jgi:hypothetical protein
MISYAVGKSVEMGPPRMRIPSPVERVAGLRRPRSERVTHQVSMKEGHVSDQLDLRGYDTSKLLDEYA